MNEIQIKGKRIDNDEWSQGYLVVDEDGKSYIVNNYGTSYTWDEVEPNTIEQCGKDYESLVSENKRLLGLLAELTACCDNPNIINGRCSKCEAM